MAEIHDFLPENSLLDAPGETSLAAFWKAADPDGFRPRIDLFEATAKHDSQNEKARYDD
jgi:hypothetical protein